MKFINTVYRFLFPPPQLKYICFNKKMNAHHFKINYSHFKNNTHGIRKSYQY